jgi:hypothetical protein
MKILNKVFTIYILMLLVSCGGGSEGTGTNSKSILGNIVLETGAPLNGAEVVVAETGDAGLTDANGDFAIVTRSDLTKINLLIEKDELKTSAELSGLDSNSSEVKVNLKVRPQGDAALVSVGYLEIWARITGNCQKYFSNKKIIEQKKNVPEDLSCTLRFFASGDGRPLARIRGQIEVRSCNSDNWRKLVNGLTGTGPNIGFGDLNFNFIDNKRNCVYRLIAPIDDPEMRQFEILIQTKTFQDRAP